MASRRAVRIARNESAFRALNESLQASVHRGRPPDALAGFVCECGDPECDTIVRLDLRTYESIREDAQLFVIVPGHAVPDVEDVVSESDGYVVVRKHPDVADIVEQRGPLGGKAG